MQILLDERINKVISDYFKSLGFEIIKIKHNTNLYNEISSHADILACLIDDKLFIEDELYKDINKKIDNKYEVINIGEINKEYPNDIKLNVCRLGNYIIHNFKYTHKLLYNYINQCYKTINVEQGYTNCNILNFGNYAITSDKGIYNNLIKNNIDCFLVEDLDLDIKLLKNNQYSTMKGFIGGCSVTIDNTVIFFGDLNNFKCKNSIIDYITSKGYKIKEFKNMDMIDYGSAVILK
jgi:hypothetical protein